MEAFLIAAVADRAEQEAVQVRELEPALVGFAKPLKLVIAR
jgi:hypothetical protein